MRLLAFALALITTLSSFGIDRADSVKVYFRAGNRQFDPALGQNRLEMDSFIAKVRQAAATDDIERIIVSGYASPEGTFKANERLAHNRCVTIADLIATKTGISRNLIEEHPVGIDWSELRRIVAETPEVPSRDKVLDILDNTPLWVYSSDGKIISGRKKQLMDLNGGRPFNWLLANIFPRMRNAVAVTLCLKEKPAPAEAAAEEIIPAEEPAEEITEAIAPIEIPADSIATAEEPAEVEYEYHHHLFALKNNILYDAALMPNLEIEWLINNNWSVALEGGVAWWKASASKIYRLWMVSPEVRYHINPRKPWHGMYVGIFGGTGVYQLQNGLKGYRGEGSMGGASFGYMWPISRNWSLEAGIGVGYLQSRYKVYENRDGHKLYLHTKSLGYFGPLKLKFSIAWRFDIKTKTVKPNSTL